MLLFFITLFEYFIQNMFHTFIFDNGEWFWYIIDLFIVNDPQVLFALFIIPMTFYFFFCNVLFIFVFQIWLVPTAFSTCFISTFTLLLVLFLLFYLLISWLCLKYSLLIFTFVLSYFSNEITRECHVNIFSMLCVIITICCVLSSKINKCLGPARMNFRIARKIIDFIVHNQPEIFLCVVHGNLFFSVKRQRLAGRRIGTRKLWW